MKRITLSQVVAYNNPEKAAEIIKRFGYQPARTQQGLALQLDKLIVVHQGVILKMIADVHPHRDLILSSLKVDNLTSNAEGETPTQEAVKPKEAVSGNGQTETLKYALIGVIGIFVGVMLFKD